MQRQRRNLQDVWGKCAIFYLGLLRLDLVDRVAALAVKEKAEVLASLGDGDDVWKGREKEIENEEEDRGEHEPKGGCSPSLLTHEASGEGQVGADLAVNEHLAKWGGRGRSTRAGRFRMEPPPDKLRPSATAQHTWRSLRIILTSWYVRAYLRRLRRKMTRGRHSRSLCGPADGRGA
jgi:hypothetical protein